jgi:hypothetical protein
MQNVISVAIVDPEPRMIEEAVQAIVAYRPQIAIYPSISLMLGNDGRHHSQSGAAV